MGEDYVQAVTRACEIVRAFRHEGEELLLADIAARTGLKRTTAFRLAQSLIRGGLLERVSRGVYRCPLPPAPGRRFRLGFVAQSESEYSREVTASLERAAAREHVDLVATDGGGSAAETLRNAERLVRDRVDLAFVFQTYDHHAASVSSTFQEAGIPVVAIENPQPGAVYFGPNNYQAGLLAGQALGRWAKENWDGEVERLLLIEVPAAGAFPALRITGILDGLREELPSSEHAPVTRMDGKGDFERILATARSHVLRDGGRRTLVGAIDDLRALAALRAFEEAGAADSCAVAGQTAVPCAREELRRAGTRLIGSVAYFPERYGNELVPLALSLLAGKPAPPATFVAHQLLTPTNVDLVYPLDLPGKAPLVAGAAGTIE
jgi:ribose transport system substrate-binding protein